MIGIAAETPATGRRRSERVRVRRLGRVEYEPTWQAMREFTERRASDTPDELWLAEHPSIYTLGVAGRSEHLPRVANRIPVLKVDRGGQITYHGPGQAIVYLLIDMRRRAISVRPLVRIIEQAVIDLLAARGVPAERRASAPGVYVRDAKIAALGLRIRNGCCYHGVAVNVDMDLSPFRAIDPCGYPGLAVTHARAVGVADSVETLSDTLATNLIGLLP